MIRSITETRTRSQEFLEKFLAECTVEEKIDAPYVQIEIRRQSLVFRKGGHKLNGVDLILNDDYTLLMKEWEMIRHVNEDWFAARVGFTISMFFLPVSTPVKTEYKEDVRYIIDNLGRWGEVENFIEDVVDMKMLDEFHVCFKHFLKKKKDVNYASLAQRFKCSQLTPEQLVENIAETSGLFAAKEPEGYILKSGHKHIYQTESKERILEQKERTQYEYLMIDFSSFWKTIDDIYAMIGNSDYVNSVCTLFNAYVEWQQQKPLKDNIDACGIEPPYLGRKPETGFRHIPNLKTVQICKKSRLMENAFKVLLVNLRKEKRLNGCVLMDKRHVERWNTIVKTLKIAVANS